MRILITGGAGFIAGYLAERLARNHQVLLTGRSREMTHLDTACQVCVPYSYTDYSVGNLTSLFKEFNPDSVVHLAAQRPDSTTNLIPEFLQNLIISTNLFSVCLSSGAKNIVNISSVSVYSEQVPLPWKEDGPTEPKNEYGLSKLWVEDTAAYFSKRGLNIKTLRLAQVVGLGERAGYLLQIYRERAISGEPLKVFGKDEGRRHYIYIWDVISAIELSLKHTELKGVYNIGMKENHSFFEVAETINTVFHNDAGIIRVPEQNADTSISKMDITKAREVLQWQPLFDLKSVYDDMYTQILKSES